jgi:hypothetical protein
MMANSLRIPLKDGQVVLMDPKEMLKAMRGWGEYDCLFVVRRGFNEPGHQVFGAGTQLGGWRLNDPPPRRYKQCNVGDILICVCKRVKLRCPNCGATHGLWVRSDGVTLIKGQPCPGPVARREEVAAAPAPYVSQPTLF